MVASTKINKLGSNKINDILAEFGFSGKFEENEPENELADPKISPLDRPKALKSNLAFTEDMAYGGGPRSLETVKKEDLVRICPDCKSKDIDYANEEFYCKKCGLVLD